jgi:huntingtin interacting protein 1
MEKRSKGWEEKFVKLKDVYQKLRDEHINLLRQKAEADKKLSVANAAIDQSNKIQAEMELSKSSAEEVAKDLQSIKLNQDEKINLLIEEKEELVKSNYQLKVS